MTDISCLGSQFLINVIPTLKRNMFCFFISSFYFIHDESCLFAFRYFLSCCNYFTLAKHFKANIALAKLGKGTYAFNALVLFTKTPALPDSSDSQFRKTILEFYTRIPLSCHLMTGYPRFSKLTSRWNFFPVFSLMLRNTIFILPQPCFGLSEELQRKLKMCIEA